MTISIGNIYNYKRLVGFANNKVYYGTGASAMIELAAASGDIDTSDNLNACEAYQKVFIANGTNLKVADFINTRLSTADIKPSGKTAPLRGAILVGVTSAAQMIVDFISATDSTAYVYGYKTTGTFSSGETVRVGDGSTYQFVINAAENAPPNWYSWTPYGNDTTTYGTMPSKAYLVALYCGRLVLSGDPNYPHQWYMSRTENPWDWLYTGDMDDSLQPIKGNDGPLGGAKGIVRALIPFRDDYLVIGEATSIQVMRGDPMAGGSLDTLDDNVGIFGNKSYCFDGEGNLYFWGTGGLYQCPRDFSGITFLTQFPLPKIIEDESPDPSTYRVCMQYDARKWGIKVFITKISDGTNTGYWYDFRTEGLYPESLPTSCGVYSTCYYDSNDPTYRGLILGCADGYLRVFDNDTKSDTTTSSTSAISSYVVLPIIKLADVENQEAVLTSVIIETSGGASDGALGDTDQVDYGLYLGDTAEVVLEDIRDGATAGKSGTLSTVGRNKINCKLRGIYLGIKLSNSTAAKSWAVNSVMIEAQPAGEKRD